MLKLHLFFVIFYLLAGQAFLGCSKTTPIVSHEEDLTQQVKQLHAGAGSVDRQAMLDELAKLSAVTENQVFTEAGGQAEYLIGPRDILEFTFWTNTAPAVYESTVRQDGAISYSFLDDVKVAGLTTRQIDQLLTEQLGRYMKRVRLDVAVKKYESKSVLVFGEINILQTGKSGPGKYSLSGKSTILDIIVTAGGFTKDADLKNVELLRKGKRYSLNLYEVMLKGDVRQNVVIDHGDLITVPELTGLAERVYVMGEVNRVGIYAHEEAYDLLAAIGKAEGFTGIAVEQDIKIIRGYGKGEPVVLTANLDALLKKGDISQNLKLLDGDVVYVPRTLVGDVNEFIANTTPLLDYLLYPANYRNRYSY